MLVFIVRRTLLIFPALLVISVIIFGLIELPPGDYLTVYMSRLEEEGMNPEDLESTISKLRVKYGMDKPFFIRYFVWLKGFLKGELGDSFLYFGVPVSRLILKRLPATILITLSTLLFSWAVAIPIGIFSAVRQYSIFDYLFTFLAFIGRSIPNFFLALLLMTMMALTFDTLVGGLFSEQFIDAPWSWAKLLDLLAHLWIPVVVIGTAGTASIMRIMRGNLLDVLNLQYVQTARAKGLAERTVIFKHAVRNALHPLVMMLGMDLPKIMSGGTIVGVVLSLPTLGPLLLEALYAQDMYLAGAILMIQILLLMVGNIIGDILLAWVDPRIKFS